MDPHPTALIIDADPAVQETLILVLKEAGYAVAGFESGEAALAALQAGILAAILVTEVRLPSLAGWQLARAVRRLRPDLPILYIPAVTGDRPQSVMRSFVLPAPFRFRAFGMAARLIEGSPATYH